MIRSRADTAIRFFTACERKAHEHHHLHRRPGRHHRLYLVVFWIALKRQRILPDRGVLEENRLFTRRRENRTGATPKTRPNFGRSATLACSCEPLRMLGLLQKLLDNLIYPVRMGNRAHVAKVLKLEEF